jgi:hypothetical protein
LGTEKLGLNPKAFEGNVELRRQCLPRSQLSSRVRR